MIKFILNLLVKHKDCYTIKYRPKGCFFSRKIRNVKKHWWEDFSTPQQKDEEGYQFGPMVCWGVREYDETITFIPIDCVFHLMPDWEKVCFERMSKEAGQPIQRAL